MIGFGNPLLDAPDASTRCKRAKLRRGQAALPGDVGAARRSLVGQRAARIAPLPRAAASPTSPTSRRQAPLPETADELCAVARDLKADVRDIRLGARATEREVKRLSAQRQSWRSTASCTSPPTARWLAS